jgi:hypothetical protein
MSDGSLPFDRQSPVQLIPGSYESRHAWSSAAPDRIVARIDLQSIRSSFSHVFFDAQDVPKSFG